jgi:AraC-like DNA-binding protein
VQTDAVDEIIVRIAYNIAMIVITAFLGFAGLRQIDIYNEIKVADMGHIDGNSHKVKDQERDEIHRQTNVAVRISNKYVASALSEEEKKKIVDVLENIMQTKKLFLNPELKITDVANEVLFPRKQISQAMNEKLCNNFYNYINRYRIEEAKRLLEDTKYSKFSIEGIAHQSGFNSRSSFYTAFRNETGVTPSQFRGKLFSS